MRGAFSWGRFPAIVRRVGIDATKLLVPHKTGIEAYASSLILAMTAQMPEHPDLELFLCFQTGNTYTNARLLPSYASRLGKARIRIWPFPRGYRLALPLMAARDRLDLLHLLAAERLHFTTCPLVVTVHDLCWTRLPQELLPEERQINRPLIQGAVRQANAFIAVSQSTKQDLVDFYGVPPHQVEVVYEGVDGFQHPGSAPVAAMRQKYELDRYILYVGTLQHRKNLVRLLEVFARLATDNTVSQTLVLAGGKGWGFAEVYQAVKRLHLDNRVRFLGYVPSEDVIGLYAGADLVVYPSLCEGFGLPPLEAMACGAVVSVSNIPALREVGGDAATYFDPRDEDNMAAIIHRALTDQQLRERCRELGIQQARRFSWEQCARGTISVYRRVIAQE